MTISEVSSKFSMTPDTLRYYEKVGLIGPISKKSGVRFYEEEDLKRIEFVKCMRKAGLPIEVLKEYLKLFDEGDSTILKRKELLLEQREILKEKMEEMQEAYDKITYKIDLLKPKVTS